VYASITYESEQKVLDTRSNNYSPNSYSKEVQYEFKTRTVVGTPEGDPTYIGVMTFAPWSDSSGDEKYQLAFSNTAGVSKLSIRAGLTTTWGSWERLWSAGDFTATDFANWDTAYGWGDHSTANYALTTGDTFTGAVVIDTDAAAAALTIGDGTSVSGDILLTFSTDRSFSFVTTGEDAANVLNLKSNSNKNFNITDSADAVQHQFTATGAYTAAGEIHADYYEATALGPNASPGTDDLYVGGYGIIGARATQIYISNATGAVALNHAGTHNVNTKLQTSSSGITVTGDVQATAIGGITQANLLDKTAAETVTGEWEFTGTATFNNARTTLNQVFINESAAADTDTLGDGQLWVKDDAPCNLYFTDDTGQDIQITDNGALAGGGGGGGTTKYKTADEKVTASTTLQNDDHLASFALTAGKYYKVEGFVVSDHDDTICDLKVQFSFTNTPQEAWFMFHGRSDGGSASDGDANEYSAAMALNTTVAGFWGWTVSGYVLANATTGGTTTMQWANNTVSIGNGTTLKKGSWLTFTQVS
jgi:hypothetical protein